MVGGGHDVVAFIRRRSICNSKKSRISYLNSSFTS